MKKTKSAVGPSVVAKFQAICGDYNLCAMKEQECGDWSCSIYKGAKRICTVEYYAEDCFGAILNMPLEELQVLSAWADQAGPLGFETPTAFIEYVFKMAMQLRHWRKSAKLGYLVAFDKSDLDDHGMPLHIKSSRSAVVTDGWIAAYKRTYPNMVILNTEL